MKSRSSQRTFGALFVASLIAAGVIALGCTPTPAPSNNGPASTPGATNAATTGATTTGATTNAAPAPEAGPETCSKYANSFCEKAGGDKSEACTSMRSVAELMPPKACAAGLAELSYTEGKLADLGKKCTELGDKLCADLGPTSQTCEMVKRLTPSFPPDRCREMLANYPQVLAELKTMEERNKPLSPEKQAEIAADDAPSFGPKDAKVTIVEFSDFECPYCSIAANVTTQIKTKYPTEVRLVFRQFPLSFHKNADLAAQAALAAGAQGKFWEYHDLLFQNQRALTRADLEKYAEQLKLDMKAFKKALDEGAHAPKIQSDMKMGEGVAVDGTPTMFLNGTRVANPTDFNTVAMLIDKELGRAPAPPELPGGAPGSAPGGAPGHEGHGHP